MVAQGIKGMLDVFYANIRVEFNRDPILQGYAACVLTEPDSYQLCLVRSPSPVYPSHEQDFFLSAVSIS